MILQNPCQCKNQRTPKEATEGQVQEEEVVVHIMCHKTVEGLAAGGCGSGKFVYAQKETGKAWEKAH